MLLWADTPWNVWYIILLTKQWIGIDLLDNWCWIWPKMTRMTSWWRSWGQATHAWESWGRSSHFHVFDLIDLRRIWPLNGTPGVRLNTHEKFGDHHPIFMYLTSLTVADSDSSVGLLGFRLHTRERFGEYRATIMYSTLTFAESNPSVLGWGSYTHAWSKLREDRIIGVGGEDREMHTPLKLMYDEDVYASDRRGHLKSHYRIA